MPQCIAAIFGSAQTLLLNLFRAPRGRHATRRSTTRFSFDRLSAERRRSRRVRRYAPALPPRPLSVPAQPDLSAQRRDQRTHPALPPTGHLPDGPVRLAPPAVRFPADEVALVRPYLSAHERTRARQEDDHRQRAAADRLAAWGADLGTLAPPPPLGPQTTRPVRVRPGHHAQAPARASGSEPRLSTRLEHRPHLSRLRRQQQQRRTQEVAV